MELYYTIYACIDRCIGGNLKVKSVVLLQHIWDGGMGVSCMVCVQSF